MVQPDESIKNLIFDLGGVILDLSIDHTLEAFSTLSGIDKPRVKSIFQTAEGFEVYERGMMTDDEFRTFVQSAYTVTAQACDIDTCWYAMLRGIPQRKLDLLLRLKEKFNVYLLSNTNGIHLDYINKNLVPGGGSLDRYFHKAYYSHLMKKRKPNADIYQQVLDESNLQPNHTLFLDDNLANVQGAEAVGIRTLHVTNPDLIYDYFHGY